LILTSFSQEGNALIFGVEWENVNKLQRDKMVYMKCIFVSSHLIKFNLVVITFEN